MSSQRERKSVNYKKKKIISNTNLYLFKFTELIYEQNQVIKEVCFTQMATPGSTPEISTSFCTTKLVERSNFPVHSDFTKMSV